MDALPVALEQRLSQRLRSIQVSIERIQDAAEASPSLPGARSESVWTTAEFERRVA